MARRTRWAARVIGTIAAVYFVVMLIASAVSEDICPITVEIGTLVLLGMLSLAGCIASWWRDKPAGILLILTSVGLGIHIGCFAGHQSCPRVGNASHLGLTPKPVHKCHHYALDKGISSL